MTAQDRKIVLYHTNDMHGSLEEMARLSSLCRRLRRADQQAGNAVFFLDAGDAADRKLSIVSNTKGAAFAPILNAMGYDLQALGNDLSLTYGPQCIPAYAARLKFPVLAANLRTPQGLPHEGVQEWASLALPGQGSIDVIGLSPRAADTMALFGIESPDPVEVVREVLGRMLPGGPGARVVLSHSGLSEDRTLAEQVPGLDLIIGGHSHSLLEHGEMVNGVLIAQAGDYAANLGRVEITLDAFGRILKKTAAVIPVPPDENPDPLVLDAIAAAKQEVEDLISRQVAWLDYPLDLDFFEECSLGSYTADAVRLRMQADAALLTSGLFHSGLPTGPVTLGQLNSACFSTANPAVTALSGAQILEALETGRSPEYSTYMFKALRGSPMGIPQVSGLQVWYTAEPQDGRRIRRVEVQGEELEPQKTYRVAHTDVEVDPHSFIRLLPGQVPRYEIPTILNEVILDRFQAGTSVQLPAAGRWVRLD